MQNERLKSLLEGCYVTVPTPFADEPGLPVNEAALRAYVRFLIDSGLNARHTRRFSPAARPAISRP